eukprot:CAMPEP_0114490090 /NCGR_PEP_ID=MMETSP0109-20121206/2245_1 /TAXON_ID=29199 /ORGANISM="Chlorarachnion reptans, Strain CCCM449" /LENGTH=54 /DNA_ID=CAMNT_0001666661 /DNA_START=287 /DNA_END=451 /DNA_ORIENTATION=-
MSFWDGQFREFIGGNDTVFDVLLFPLYTIDDEFSLSNFNSIPTDSNNPLDEDII